MGCFSYENIVHFLVLRKFRPAWTWATGIRSATWATTHPTQFQQPQEFPCVTCELLSLPRSIHMVGQAMNERIRGLSSTLILLHTRIWCGAFIPSKRAPARPVGHDAPQGRRRLLNTLQSFAIQGMYYG